jgi:hypothetical protein
MRRIGRKRTGGEILFWLRDTNSHEAVDVNVIDVRLIKCVELRCLHFDASA